MKIAVMQPYLFPFIGYFQLIKEVDLFLIYDNVQYQKRGWINRNRILHGDTDYLFTFSLTKDSQYKNINERYFTGQFKEEIQKFLKTLQFAYGKAPYYKRTRQFAIEVFSTMKPDKQQENIAKKIGRSIQETASWLSIDTDFKYSSDLVVESTKSGQYRIIELAKQVDADIYVNMISGQELYDETEFQKQNINLQFLDPKNQPYEQSTAKFIPNLSIIDIMMYNSKSDIQDMLNAHSVKSEV